jgi:hypothetical protein
MSAEQGSQLFVYGRLRCEVEAAGFILFAEHAAYFDDGRVQAKMYDFSPTRASCSQTVPTTKLLVRPTRCAGQPRRPPFSIGMQAWPAPALANSRSMNAGAFKLRQIGTAV